MESCIFNERSWYFLCHVNVGVVPNYRIELVSGKRHCHGYSFCKIQCCWVFPIMLEATSLGGMTWIKTKNFENVRSARAH